MTKITSKHTTILRTLATSFALAMTLLAGSSASASLPEGAGVLEDVIEHVDDGVSEAQPEGVAVTLDGTININEASAAELELLPGVGPAIAQRIVDYRADRPFKQLNHLMRVKGVGKKTYLKVKPYIAIEGDTTLRIAG